MTLYPLCVCVSVCVCEGIVCEDLCGGRERERESTVITVQNWFARTDLQAMNQKIPLALRAM